MRVSYPGIESAVQFRPQPPSSGAVSALDSGSSPARLARARAATVLIQGLLIDVIQHVHFASPRCRSAGSLFLGRSFDFFDDGSAEERFQGRPKAFPIWVVSFNRRFDSGPLLP